MPDVLKGFSTRATPQSQPAGGATVKNAAGGYTFSVSDEQRVRRFIVLGSESTYYTSAPDLTRDNAEAVIRLAGSDPRGLVEMIIDISVAGRAPRQNPAIFALAIAASIPTDHNHRAYALSAVPQVCRTGTHLFLFLGYVKQFRGWGPALKRAVTAWYVDKPVDKLTYQVLKYRSREGFTHRDALRLTKPVIPAGTDRDALFSWIVGKDGKRDNLPALVGAYEAVQHSSPVGAVNAIAKYDLSWEMLPDRLLNEPMVWEALLARGMPQTALMRQLPRLTRLGLTTSKTGLVIAAQLQDGEHLKRGRVHPINVLVAQRTYASGHSARGESTWTPTPRITDALDAAFYAAYGAVEPSGVPMLLACDVSGSMTSPVSGLPLSCREAVAALSLVTLNVESDAEIIGFSDGQTRGRGYGMFSQAIASRLDISPRRRLDDVCNYMAGLNFGRTDVSLPMIWAMKNKLDFSAIVTMTDNETWFGNVHPHEALKTYREHVGHDVKYTVVSMTATGNSVADPNDPSSLDIAGLDSSVPQVISEFAAGRI